MRILYVLAAVLYLTMVYPAAGATTNTVNNVTNDPWVDVRNFPDLSAAIASPMTLNKKIVISSWQTVNDLDVPSTRAIEVLKGGGIAVNRGRTLTIHGPFTAGLHSAFTGEGTVIFGEGSVKECFTEWFGASGDGITDDYAAISRAVASLPAKGGRISLLAKTYAVSQTLIIGDGSVSQSSTKQNIKITGMGIGGSDQTITGANTGTRLKWTGTAGGTVVRVNGPITGMELKDFQIDCNMRAATGLDLMHPQFSNFESIQIIKANAPAPYTAFAVRLDNYKQNTSSTSRGAISNTFNKLIIRDGGTNYNGILIGSNTWMSGDGWDVLQTTFTDCTFTSSSATAGSNCAAMQLQFVDNISFYNCIVSQFNPNNGRALRIKSPDGNAAFPSEISFFNTAVIGGLEVSGKWKPASNAGLRFNPWHTADGEALPTVPYISGETSSGRKFGMNFSGCLLRDSGAVNVPIPNGTETTLHWGQVITDIENMRATVAGVDAIKPAFTGLYRIDADIEWSANATGIRKLSIWKKDPSLGDVEIATNVITPLAANNTTQRISVLDEDTDANSFYYVKAYQSNNSATALDKVRQNHPNPRSNKFTVIRIR